MTLLTKRDWRGQEHIPATGGVVLVTNHVSYFDPFAFAHFVYDAGRLPRYLAKSEVFTIPVLGKIVGKLGQIPVYRQTTDATTAFRAAVEGIEHGECIVIYPEGTVSRDPGLWPMVGKTGAARVALTTGCPVIPIAQWGPQEVLSPYSKRPLLLPVKTMHIQAGPPVDLSRFAGMPLTAATLRDATEVIMAAITEQLEKIRGEQAPPERFDMRKAGVVETGNPDKPRKTRPAGRGPAEPSRTERAAPDPTEPGATEPSATDGGAR
ncbi:MAG TPA: lysophospholipid acyltransferase family protein [Actinomycetes bacterium]|nr:lysophospholipid acyltransferase family protein [Actinomycetes bacterium]